jgi:hypothetical protein
MGAAQTPRQPPRGVVSDGTLLKWLDWADLREDKMINPAPGFWPILGPLGPTASPGSHGIGHGLKNSADYTKNQPRIPILSPIRWHRVFLGPTAKIQKDK